MNLLPRLVLAGLSAVAGAWVSRALAVCPLPVIVQPPANLTIVENQTATFTVAVAATAPASYAWSLNGSPMSNGGLISGADAATLTIRPVPLTWDGSQFQVIVTDACGSVTSAIPVLHVLADTQPPAVLSAVARCRSNQVLVTYSEPVDPVSAADPVAYQVDGAPLSIASAAMLSPTEVVLTLPGLDDLDVDLQLSVSGVRDLAATPNVLQPEPSLVPLVTRCRRCGRIVESVLTCGPSPVGVCTWTFQVQNLSTALVKYVFLAPMPPCFTVAGVHPLPNLLAPGQTVPLSVTFSNVSADCGPALCLFVSLHDSNLVQCCSFTNCLPNPLAASNAPPSLKCPDPVRLCTRSTNASVTLTAQASDPDGDALSVEWRVNGALVSTGALTLTYSFPLGTHTVQVTVSDGHTTVTCTTTVTVLPAPRMSIRIEGKDVVLTWTGEGMLQCATEVTGPWPDVPGAVSPYRTPADAKHRFYRVRCPRDP